MPSSGAMPSSDPNMKYMTGGQVDTFAEEEDRFADEAYADAAVEDFENARSGADGFLKNTGEFLRHPIKFNREYYQSMKLQTRIVFWVLFAAWLLLIGLAAYRWFTASHEHGVYFWLHTVAMLVLIVVIGIVVSYWHIYFSYCLIKGQCDILAWVTAGMLISGFAYVVAFKSKDLQPNWRSIAQAGFSTAALPNEFVMNKLSSRLI